MFGVLRCGSEVPERLRFGQRRSERLFHDAGNSEVQQFDSKFRNILRRHNGDAAVEILLPQHFLDVPISRHKAILSAEI